MIPSRKFQVKTQLGIYLLIVSLGFLVYSNHLQNPFQFDSVQSILKNPDYKKPEDLLNIGFLKQEFFSRSFLRITFAWNAHLAQMNPFGYHLFNLLFHIINSILVFFFIWHLLLRMRPDPQNLTQGEIRSVSLLTALAFLCHPIQTESTLYITSRSEILAATFYLGAFLVFQRCLNSEHPAPSRTHRFLFMPLFVTAAFILGYSVKQSFITLFPAMTLYYLLGLPFQSPVWQGLKRWKYIIGVLIFIFLAVLFKKLLSDEKFLIGPSNAGEVIGRKAYLLSQPGVIAFYYLKLLLFPINLNIDPDIEKGTFSLKFIFGTISIILFFVMVGFSRFRRLYFFLGFWFFLVLSPSSSIITLLDLAAEHRVYLAALGFFGIFSVLVILVFRALKTIGLKPYWISKTLTSILVMMLCVITLDRNGVWSSHLQLWMDTLKKSPNKERPWMNVGHAHILLGNDDEAIFYYEKANSLDPFYFVSQYNLGHLYEKKKDIAKALIHYHQAARINPLVPEVNGKLGEIYLHIGQYETANIYLRRAVERNPNYAEAFRNLGVLHYYYIKNQTQALVFFKHSLNLDPNQPDKDLILKLLEKSRAQNQTNGIPRK